MWPANLSVRLPVIALVSRYLTNKLIGLGPLHERNHLYRPGRIRYGLSGISSPFELLSPSRGQVIQALLTLTPLYLSPRREPFAFDLHA